ncbi:MAG: helix-turn-helix transcriptional regulator [Clostridia bacterium]|nr:helix-turn-helix transcriptional regulator [Clostridia bacterium]
MEKEHDLAYHHIVRHIHLYVSEIRLAEEHTHTSFELSYVLGGEALYFCGADSFPVSPGDLILTNPYEPHSFLPRKGGTVTLLTLQIHRLFLRPYIENVPRRFRADQLYSLPSEFRETIVSLLFRTACAYFESRSDQLYNVVGNATLLMGQLVSRLEWDAVIRADDLDQKLRDNRVERIVNYIDENYRSKITLAKLADMENISTTYLSHFFTRAFGVPFHIYLSRIRFEKALVLLRDPSFSLVDICMNCGFSDTRYLETACQRTFGCSVGEYRKRCEQDETFDPANDETTSLKRLNRRESRKVLKSYLGENRYASFV